MKLELLQAELRPRSPFEAMDLGLVMLRTWWRQVYVPWLIVVVPTWVLVFAVLRKAPFLAFMLLWWLRPAFERLLLHVLSRGLFGALPTPRESLRAFPGLFFQRLGSSLFLHRLDPTRTFTAPVIQLEGLKGSQASRRRAQVRSQNGAAAAFLTFMAVSMEFLISVGLFAAVLMFLPDTPQYNELLWENLSDFHVPVWMRITLPALLAASYALVAPVNVACGFGLYINRRTLLEGWDVEIRFRQMATRLRQVGAGVLILGLGLAWSGPVHAQDGIRSIFTDKTAEQEAAAALDETPEETAARVLADPDFATKEERTTWKPKEERDPIDLFNGCEAAEPTQTPELPLPVGAGLEVILWVVIGLALIALLIAILRSRTGSLKDALARPLPASRSGREQPEPERLPDDLATVAAKLWASGDQDGALALLYRGAVADLVNRGLPIDEGATEGECLRIVRRKLKGDIRDYFRDLTRAWQERAYAHRDIDHDRGAQLIKSWSAHFREVPG